MTTSRRRSLSLSRPPSRTHDTAFLPALRPALRRDLVAILALEAACFPASDRFSRRTWRHLLTSRSVRTFVLPDADRSGLLAGAICFLLRRGARLARIYSLCVAPAARGRGIGRRLVTASVPLLPARIRGLGLEVRADNTTAQALYAKLGFRIVAELPGYYRNAVPSDPPAALTSASGAGVRMRVRLPLPACDP